MKSRIAIFLIAGIVGLGITLGFSIKDNPSGSKTNRSSSWGPNGTNI